MVGQDLPFHSEEVNRRGLKQGRANGAIGIHNRSLAGSRASDAHVDLNVVDVAVSKA